ncbi:serine/threonine-protein kinase [Nonomuraea jabiensis]|uniref:non-specific serine/threonine protein kinase n=1 Tax=Nonomuraea jabiensis TaxID=882448 RepID=A0A7W9LDF7_9ACTN|nr:serine/threonine-protein kinase [Nonomuraea jabiensis]MBB5779729.1 serine/threonine-protein kinase [Nonomuraea jabiensis]
MSDATPSVVADRYRLDERISSGPMGEVWRGYDTRADWVVAVKVLGARVAGGATREVLRQHAQAVARVIHPNVAMVLDVGDHDGAPFLVMEFLTGPSLGEELATRGPLPIVEVCDLVGQAAAGLDAAHRAGVVHGHVAPHSFRLAGSGVLKVVGFGMDDRVPADPRYVAPERAAGQEAAAAGDLYALGCVCYELLCGRPPFGDEAQDGSGGVSGRGVPAPPSVSRAEVPAELDRLVLAMIAEDPAQRPGSGEAIRRALAAIARPRANPAAPPAAAPPAAPPAAAPPAAAPPVPPGPGQAAPVQPLPGAAMPVTGVSLRDGGVPPGGPGGTSGAGTSGVGTSGAGTFGGGTARGDGATEVFQVPGHGGPPRAGDTAIYQAGDLEPAPGPNRKLILQLGAAVVVIAVVTVVMVMWAGARKEEPLTASTPTAEPTAEPTADPTILPSVATLPTEESTPDSTPGLVNTLGPTSLRETVQPKATLGEAIPPGGWGKWLSEFDKALMAQQAMGTIDPKVADKARDKIRKAARKFAEGRIDAGIDQVAGVYHDLRRAQEKGGMGAGPAAQVLDDWRLPDD